jgi:hypothetical protein
LVPPAGNFLPPWGGTKISLYHGPSGDFGVLTGRECAFGGKKFPTGGRARASLYLLACAFEATLRTSLLAIFLFKGAWRNLARLPNPRLPGLRFFLTTPPRPPARRLRLCLWSRGCSWTSRGRGAGMCSVKGEAEKPSPYMHSYRPARTVRSDKWPTMAGLGLFKQKSARALAPRKGFASICP